MQDYGYMSAMRKYVTFSGRAPRQEYWMFTLVVVILSIIAAVIDAFVFGASPESFGILGLIVSLPICFLVLQSPSGVFTIPMAQDGGY